LASFDKSELFQLFADHQVVRSTMLRRTIHLACAEDFAWLRPTLQPAVRRLANAAYYAGEVDGIDLTRLAEVGAELLGEKMIVRRDLGKQLVERFPDRHSGRLANVVELLLPLVHDERTSSWGSWSSRRDIGVATAEAWTGRAMGAPDAEKLITRYLAAFGPASVTDMQAWSGLTRLREVVEGMRHALRTYRTEEGAELFDLPDALLSDPDKPAPVRFLPAFDNALLGYRDRTRAISRADSARFAKDASGGIPMFLVDGFVAGTWAVNTGEVVVDPLRELSTTDAEAVAHEARRVAEFVFSTM
jgi:hypothetical protein